MGEHAFSSAPEHDLLSYERIGLIIRLILSSIYRITTINGDVEIAAHLCMLIVFENAGFRVGIDADEKFKTQKCFTL